MDNARSYERERRCRDDGPEGDAQDEGVCDPQNKGDRRRRPRGQGEGEERGEKRAAHWPFYLFVASLPACNETRASGTHYDGNGGTMPRAIYCRAYPDGGPV